MKMIRVLEAAALAYLMGTSAFAGAWALFLPRYFYENFPGFGHTWVSVDGPYNEHFIRDLGALQLALALLAAVCLFARPHVSVRTVALCTLMFNLPHFVYHVIHLGAFSSSFDRVANVMVLGAGVLVPVLLLILSAAAIKSVSPKTAQQYR
jgi:hypothetical protein